MRNRIIVMTNYNYRTKTGEKHTAGWDSLPFPGPELTQLSPYFRHTT